MAGDWKAKLAAIDYVGCVLALAGTTLLLVGILRGGIEVPWSDASTIVPMIIAMLCFIAFALWEVKGARIPVVPLRLFCIPTVAGVHLATLASQAAAFVILYDMPVWLQVSVFKYYVSQPGLRKNWAGRPRSTNRHQWCRYPAIRHWPQSRRLPERTLRQQDRLASTYYTDSHLQARLNNFTLLEPSISL